MIKVKKQYLTPKWIKVKEMYQKGTNGSDKYGKNFKINGELDILASEIVDIVGELSRRCGANCTIEEIHMNLWKERIWSLIENAGLLPEIAWKDDLAKDEEIAAKKATDNDFFNNEFNDAQIDEYEPTDEELMLIEKY